MDHETEILARGWLALRQLEQHAAGAGIPVLTPSACRDCMRYAARLLRGDTPEGALPLRCEDAQRWHADVVAADVVALNLSRRNPNLQK